MLVVANYKRDRKLSLIRLCISVIESCLNFALRRKTILLSDLQILSLGRRKYSLKLSFNETNPSMCMNRTQVLVDDASWLSYWLRRLGSVNAKLSTSRRIITNRSTKNYRNFLFINLSKIYNTYQWTDGSPWNIHLSSVGYH